MALFSNSNSKEKKHSGVMGAFSVDVIKWEPEYDQEAAIVVHKYEYEDFPNGSYLIVGPSQMAVFVNNMNAGNSLGDEGPGTAQVSTFIGPCKIKLETGNSRFAPFRSISQSLTDKESAFHSTVYFVNTTYMNELSWGTNAPIVVVDPEEEVNVHVRAYGLFGVHIEKTDTSKAELQARRFLQKIVGTRADYTRDELISFMRAKILEYVPDLLANQIIRENIGVLKISAYLSEFSKMIYEKLVDHFDEFGLTLDNFSFHNINVPDEDLELINQMKIQRKQNQLEAEGNAAKMDIESAARARMRQREGYTYQQEKAYDVMQEAAGNKGTSSNIMGAGMGLQMGVAMGEVFGAGMRNVGQTAFENQNMTIQQKNTGAEEPKICSHCGVSNQKAARFCINCGEKFVSKELVCPNCGEQVQPGAKFCMHCGQRLQMNAICPGCGKTVEAGARFCMECGTKIF